MYSTVYLTRLFLLKMFTKRKHSGITIMRHIHMYKNLVSKQVANLTHFFTLFFKNQICGTVLGLAA